MKTILKKALLSILKKNVQRISEVKKLNVSNTRLTSSEMTNLFTQFQQGTMSICICKHVLARQRMFKFVPIINYSWIYLKNMPKG